MDEIKIGKGNGLPGVRLELGQNYNLDERMTMIDARKMLRIMNDCCKGLLFTKTEIGQIAAICLKAIERAEGEE